MAGGRGSSLRKHSTDPGGEFEDEVRREDGLARHWMFLNGYSVLLFVALASALFGVLWCFLSIVGIAQSFWKNVVDALALLSFAVWRIFDAHHRKYVQGVARPFICSLIHSRGRLQSFGRLADCWRAAVPAEVPA
jgi:hypothetical protein